VSAASDNSEVFAVILRSGHSAADSMRHRWRADPAVDDTQAIHIVIPSATPLRWLKTAHFIRHDKLLDRAALPTAIESIPATWVQAILLREA
jgi:hypothetical protein